MSKQDDTSIGVTIGHATCWVHAIFMADVEPQGDTSIVSLERSARFSSTLLGVHVFHASMSSWFAEVFYDTLACASVCALGLQMNIRVTMGGLSTLLYIARDSILQVMWSFGGHVAYERPILLIHAGYNQLELGVECAGVIT
jgi:hypothetical protein